MSVLSFVWRESNSFLKFDYLHRSRSSSKRPQLLDLRRTCPASETIIVAFFFLFYLTSPLPNALHLIPLNHTLYFLNQSSLVGISRRYWHIFERIVDVNPFWFVHFLTWRPENKVLEQITLICGRNLQQSSQHCERLLCSQKDYAYYA